ncbi:hypothetical protein OF122_15740 [Pelagibacterium flavum]|uniref:MFS transporter n=1 Tax=Pelagibacterium flavum TaxID=2984530 RepID=A0ABY6ILL6_9HYPH|nr:hypothetical protein [Pelagibacterium sp. YIM 151497]UYQ71485.1 hypothetical protein OF122_15740 [Pelagibacterium sp. YIM 151497]
MFALYGLAAYSLYAIAVAHANDFADDGSFAKIASGMLLVLGSGQMLGPIVASMTMQWLGPVAMFIVPVAFHGALAATAYFRMRIRDAAPAEDRAPFQPMPSERLVTGETLNLDPRSEENGFEFEEDAGEAPSPDGIEPQQG